MKKMMNKWTTALVLGVFSLPASAAFVQYDATIDDCDDGGSGACGFLNVPIGGDIQGFFDVPDGPTGPILAGDISGFNPDFGGSELPNPLMRVAGFGALSGPVTDSTLSIGMDNIPVSGFIDVLWVQPGDGRSIITTFNADGTFSSEFRNGLLDAPVLFTSSGSGTWSDFNAAPPAVPVPAAVWLFGSGLLGLVGVARRRRAA